MTTAKRKLIGGALAFVAAFMLATVGFAQQGGGHGFGGPPPGGPHGGGPHGGGPGGPHGGLGPLARDLNLTDAQKAEVKKITDSFEESTKSLRDQMFKAGGGPFDALTGAAFDEAAVRAAAQARANLHVEMEVAHARMMSQIYALLTAEQKAKVAEHRAQFEQRGRERRPDDARRPDNR